MRCFDPPLSQTQVLLKSKSGSCLCRGLLFLWLLQRPVSPLCDELGAKPWVKRLVGFFYMQLQRNVDRPAAAARDTGAGSAAEEAEGDADGLLWHLAFGSNMNPEVRMCYNLFT